MNATDCDPSDIHHLETSIHELRVDIKDLRDTRFKPYITTVGALVTLFLAGLGYIYNLEHSLNDAMDRLANEIHDLESYERISIERDGSLAAALAADNNTLLEAIVRHDNRHMQEAAVRNRMMTQMDTLRGIFMDIHKGEEKE
jgi:hypothetical protein